MFQASRTRAGPVPEVIHTRRCFCFAHRGYNSEKKVCSVVAVSPAGAGRVAAEVIEQLKSCANPAAC